MTLSACINQKIQTEKLITSPIQLVKIKFPEEDFVCHLENEALWVPTSAAAQTLFESAEIQNIKEDIPVSTKIESYEASLRLYHPKALERMLEIYQTLSTKELVSKIEATTKANNDSEVNQTGIKPSDYEDKILHIYKQMIDHQLPIGYTYLGLLYQQGQLVNKNLDKAYLYLKMAALMGNPRAQFLLGDYYFYILGDYQNGLKAHNCALAQSFYDSYHAMALGKEIFEKNYPQSLELHIKAAEHGYFKSLILLRSVFRDGLYGYDKDPDLTACFDQFIQTYSDNPDKIEGLEKACPLPEHPTLKFGEQENNVMVYKVEKKFNPAKKKRDDKLDKNSNKVKEKSLKKMRATLRHLKLNQSRF